jgi:hypothetical protein
MNQWYFLKIWSNRKFRENLIAKQFGPRSVYQFLAFGAKKGKWIENVEGFVVFDIDHRRLVN